MRLSAQLYTVRQVGDLAAQLDLVAACGYADIETIGFHDLSVPQMVGQVRSSGLTVRSMHFDWQEFETRFDDILTLLAELHCPVAVMPWLAPGMRPGTTRGWMAVADQLAHWAGRLSDSHVRLAYHNHDFDICEQAGDSPLDMILSHEGLHWQPDIGWLAVALRDPLTLLCRHSSRIVSAHIKDAKPLAGQGDDRWRNPGQGVVDWPAVLRVLDDSPCADLFVEHDETPDHRETLVSGRRFLLDQLMAGVG